MKRILAGTGLLLILLFVTNQTFASSDSIRVSCEEWQSLQQRVEALEQAQAAADQKQDIPKNNEVPGWIHNRLRIGGYGEITAKRCFYSNKYVRYITPEKYKNDSYGEFDLGRPVSRQASSTGC